MSHKALSLSTVEKFVPLAARKGVSEVARSSRGFVQAYRRAGGKLSAMSPEWQAKREGFIERHMAQVKMRGEQLFDAKGLPSRRHLALIMWAYSPSPGKLKSVPAENPVVSGSHQDWVRSQDKALRTGDPSSVAFTDIVYAGGDWRKHSVSEIESSWDTMTSAELYEIISDADDYEAGAVDIDMLRAKGYSEDLLRDVERGDFSALGAEINDWFVDVYAKLAKALDEKAEYAAERVDADDFADYVDNDSIIEEAKEIAESEFGWFLERSAIKSKIKDIRNGALELDVGTGGFWEEEINIDLEETDEDVFTAADIRAPASGGRTEVSASSLQLDAGDWDQVRDSCSVAKLEVGHIEVQLSYRKDPKKPIRLGFTVPVTIHAKLGRPSLEDILATLVMEDDEDEADVPRPKKSDEAFWAWFGNSVVVDDEGNPKVCYHGTRKGGFTVFSKSKIDAHHAGFFFANKLAVSRTYTTSSKEPIKMSLPAESTITAEFPEPGIYRVFLRIENPLVVDAKGAQWNKILFVENPIPCEVVFDELVRCYGEHYDNSLVREWTYNTHMRGMPVVQQTRKHLGVVADEDGDDSAEDAYRVLRFLVDVWRKSQGEPIAQFPWLDTESWVVPKPKAVMDRDSLARLILAFAPNVGVAGQLLADYPNLLQVLRDSLDNLGSVKLSGDAFVKTRKTKTDRLAHIAKERGHDGLIVENVHDSGGETGADPVGTVYVVFDPTQVKSVHNVGTWSRTDEDIRRNPRRKRR